MEAPGAADQAELLAMEDFLTAAPPALGAACKRSGSAVALRLATARQQPEFNRILGLMDVRQLDDLEGVYGTASYWISLEPATGLGAALRERGFTPAYPWQKFERGLEAYEAGTALDVCDAREPGDFADALLAGYGLPPELASWVGALVGRVGWHCFVAYDGPTPAAAGALYASGASGWLGATATRAEFRGRGAQGAILAARIARARSLGLRQLFTETGAPRDGIPGPSYRNIIRAGFREAYVRPNYLSPG